MKKLFILFITSLLFLSIPNAVKADTTYYRDGSPYQTYTVDFEGKLTPTQTAYQPVGVFNRDRVLNAPADLHIANNLVYVADAMNKRVAVFDFSGVLTQTITHPSFSNPQGVFANQEAIYVADKGAQAVFKFALDGTFIRQFMKPTEPLFGSNSVFVPMKVAVGRGENIYVISDGSTSGVIQLNFDGSFLGYFGVNLASKPFLQRLADLVVITDRYAKTTPPSPTNIAINEQSLVYTATPLTDQALKKLDINGNNILTTSNYNPTKNVVDLTVDARGYLYAIYDDGLVVEYDPDGNLLFAFNILQANLEILGLVMVPSGIAVDELGYIYVTDQLKNRIVVLEPTEFNRLVHRAIDAYNEGGYLESKLLFERVTRQNANFALAHSALGKAYYQEGLIDQARYEYRLANDRSGYSEAFWKIRDQWLKANLSVVFTLLLIGFAVMTTLKQIAKRTPVFALIQHQVKDVLNHPIVRQYSLVFQMLKRPLHSFYEIKRTKRATVLSASVLLGILFILYLAMKIGVGYLFNPYPDTLNLVLEAATFFGFIGLFVLANYLISTLSDGEGWLKDVYIATVYSLAPLLIHLIPYILLTNVATLNETILVRLYEFVLIVWTLVLVYLSIQEIHNYEIKETLKNLLMTFFAMFIIILIGFILYVFGSQLLSFIQSYLEEVWNRVFSG